jgi:hypothetical protein
MDFPLQVTGRTKGRLAAGAGRFDMRDGLTPRRLTIAMWDQAYLMRHTAGGSFEDYDRVLDETLERGYNTVRIDPLPQLLDLARPEAVFTWGDPHAPYMPWGWDRGAYGPLGAWLIDFWRKCADEAWATR